MEAQPRGEPTPKETHQKCPNEISSDELVMKLCKYLLLLASIVATVTYAVGFNPPGGVWQDTAGNLAGEPIIRETHYRRYLFFFYSNTAAFASSLVVIILMLLLDFVHKNDYTWLIYKPLRLVLLLDLLSLMLAYAAGTCRDMFTTLYFSVLVAVFFVFLLFQMCQASITDKKTTENAPDLEKANAQDEEKERRLRSHKVLMVLATFAVSVTYVAGLSTPGGFWDSTGGGYRPGDSILKDRHNKRMSAFFVGNTTAFAASLQIIVVLLDRKLVFDLRKAYVFITVALYGLVVAYFAGSCRGADTVVYLAILVMACTGFQLVLFSLHFGPGSFSYKKEKKQTIRVATESVVAAGRLQRLRDVVARRTKKVADDRTVRDAVDKARSLVLLLATLAATITYEAGLNPPGGLWQDNGDEHMAGDPILLTTNSRRYKTFFYCNSIAFATSLIAVVVVQNKLLLAYHVLEVAMVLDLFGLIGAYAAGSCRDTETSIHVLGLAGAVLVYVVTHVVLLTLGGMVTGTSTKEEDELVEKTRKRLLLFAILAATITYQAGLTPPGGFRLQDDESAGTHAGDPVLLYNYPRRYHAFFYSNSVSFMLSMVLIILLFNPHVYRLAIRTHALSVCTAVGLFALMGAYAAGSTQHLRTSIDIFVMVAVVLCFVVGLLIGFLVKKGCNTGAIKTTTKREKTEDKRTRHAKRKYLTLLGVLVASVTYQAGLTPPGGTWQSNGSGHEAGDPVMHDNRRARYLAFFYSNSLSFATSSVVIVLLLPKSMQKKNDNFWLRAVNSMIVLDLLGLLGAYAAGTSRGWKTSLYVVALVFAVLVYIAVHVMVSLFVDLRRTPGRQENGPQPPTT
ncbi:hypothetical protein ACQ4PT_047503 [Festuca glaucescens]